MADEKKDKGDDLGEHTVHVTVTPQDGKDRATERSNKEAAEKVKEKIKDQVKDEIKKREGQGSRKQLDVVDDVADAAKKGMSPQKVKHVDIKVDGKTKDGEEVTRRRKVTPKG